jgi:hypothetical protein
MLRNKQQNIKRRVGPSRIVTGFMALATTAVISTAGVAAAQSPEHGHHGHHNNGNHGQHNNGNHSGSGYGGNTTTQNFTIQIHDIYNSVVNVVINVWPK